MKKLFKVALVCFLAVGIFANPSFAQKAEDLCVNQAPIVVAYVFPTTLYVGENITCNGVGSYDPDGTIVESGWFFGDGSFENSRIASHSFASSGIYTVVFKIKDNDGGVAQKDFEISVLNKQNNPPVEVSTLSPLSGIANETVFCGDGSASYDLDGESLSHIWNFSGTVYNTAIANHIFSKTGNFVVTHTVSDGKENRTKNYSVTVGEKGNQAPVARLQIFPNTVFENQEVTLDGSASKDFDGQIKTYSFDFGDGTNKITTQSAVKHIYQKGTYQAKLTVTDDKGATDTDTASLAVQEKDEEFTVWAVIAAWQDTTNPFVWEFDGSNSYVFPKDKNKKIINYKWTIERSVIYGMGTKYTFPKSGTYTVALTVTSNFGKEDTITEKIYIDERPEKPCPELKISGDYREMGFFWDTERMKWMFSGKVSLILEEAPEEGELLLFRRYSTYEEDFIRTGGEDSKDALSTHHKTDYELVAVYAFDGSTTVFSYEDQPLIRGVEYEYSWRQDCGGSMGIPLVGSFLRIPKISPENYFSGTNK